MARWRDRFKRVRFERHWTMSSGSDHKVLFTLVSIRKPGSGWVKVLLISVNMGGRFDLADMAKILMVARAIKVPFVICAQEAGDQDWLEGFARVNDLRYEGGTGKRGQASTPVLVDEQIEVRSAWWVRVLARMFVGKGAGPDWNKDKWWTRNHLVLKGVPFGVSSVHDLASQHNDRRFLGAVRSWMKVLPVMLSVRRPLFRVGDINSDHDERLSRWLRGHGLTSNHAVLGKIATHHQRGIDGVWVAARLVVRRAS